MSGPQTPTRLDKCVAELLRCSRADARQYIAGGWVRVDGRVVEDAQAPITGEAVELDPGARLDPVEPATMLLHKPAGIATDATPTLVRPDTRTEGDATGIRTLQHHFRHLAPLMPLDDEASGLLVLTQDGRVRRRLTEDQASIEQEFIVEVDGELPPWGIPRLAHGLSYQGRKLPPCKVSWQNEVRLRFAIKDVRPGQLRHMCSEVGLGVVAIRRIRIGRIAMGKMPVGQWRHLPAGERF